jgi:hypothetical protein
MQDFVKRNSLVDLAVSVNYRDIGRKNGVGKKEYKNRKYFDQQMVIIE